jgi:ADP-ribose pyrophosphatase
MKMPKSGRHISIKTQTNRQDDESIKGIVRVRLSKALEMIKGGTIRDAKTVCSILMCANSNL